jgi:hypothetical protein
MNQLGINFDLPPQPAHDAESLTLIDVVHCRPGLFRADFADWLQENWPIWKAFEREANAVWRNGRRHYSARTIGEYLRHETALREDGEWKINNNIVPDMARLYGLMYPERDLFEFRGERKAA